MNQPSLSLAARELLAWAARNDFRGNDPHDLLESPALRRAKQPLARLIALQLGRRSMIDLRSILKVPPSENPKGLALFLSGLLCARERVSDDWNGEAIQLGKRLVEATHSEGGWGYPFSWQSRTHFVPKGTPNIVTTSFVGSALLSLYAIDPTSQILEVVRRATDYISHTLPRTDTAQGIAFGYAKDDPQIVFNASLLGAEFLARAGGLFASQDYLQLARRAAWFVMGHQHENGSWIYGLEPSQTWIDSFHTGFVLVSLLSIGEMLGDSTILTAAERGYEYYRETFIDKDHAVKYYHNKRYPIDAHAIGQAMVTLNAFGDADAARAVGEWAVDHMRSPEGYFYYQAHRLFKNKIAYLRWSNGWMFRGLCDSVSKELAL